MYTYNALITEIYVSYGSHLINNAINITPNRSKKFCVTIFTINYLTIQKQTDESLNTEVGFLNVNNRLQTNGLEDVISSQLESSSWKSTRVQKSHL
jgi:hypothetical protein